jgi:hypothetical protein
MVLGIGIPFFASPSATKYWSRGITLKPRYGRHAVARHESFDERDPVNLQARGNKRHA